jgi:hypothetical protein
MAAAAPRATAYLTLYSARPEGLAQVRSTPKTSFVFRLACACDFNIRGGIHASNSQKKEVDQRSSTPLPGFMGCGVQRLS